MMVVLMTMMMMILNFNQHFLSDGVTSYPKLLHAKLAAHGPGLSTQRVLRKRVYGPIFDRNSV